MIEGTKSQMKYIQLAEQAGFRVQEALARAEYVARRHGMAAVASEHYRFVTQKDIEAFNKRLHRSTEKRERFGDRTYLYLKTVMLGEYDGAPPPDVIAKVLEARERRCFESLEVAFIAQGRERRPATFDPIIFGSINGDDRRWIVAQWGDDVKPEDIAEPR